MTGTSGSSSDINNGQCVGAEILSYPSLLLSLPTVHRRLDFTSLPQGNSRAPQRHEHGRASTAGSLYGLETIASTCGRPGLEPNVDGADWAHLPDIFQAAAGKPPYAGGTRSSFKTAFPSLSRHRAIFPRFRLPA